MYVFCISVFMCHYSVIVQNNRSYFVFVSENVELVYEHQSTNSTYLFLLAQCTGKGWNSFEAEDVEYVIRNIRHQTTNRK